MLDLTSRQFAVAINTMQTGKLPKDDPRWSSFNRSFQNKELTTMDFANEIYTGHAYTSWHRGERRSENWERSQFLAADMDTADTRSSIATLRQHELVRMFGSIVHTTPSHTPEAPRARVVFLLDRPMDSPEAWSQAAKFVSHLLGADGKATDCSRFFFGNDHAEMEVYDHVLPVTKLRLMYKRWRSNGGKFADEIRPRAIHVPEGTVEAQVSQTRSRTEKHPLAEAEYILARIGPWDLDYHDWQRMISALHYEFGMVALPLAERWAQGKPGEVQRMFNTYERHAFRSDTHQSKWGTIHYLASLHNALPPRGMFAAE